MKSKFNHKASYLIITFLITSYHYYENGWMIYASLAVALLGILSIFKSNDNIHEGGIDIANMSDIA